VLLDNIVPYITLYYVNRNATKLISGYTGSNGYNATVETQLLWSWNHGYSNCTSIYILAASYADSLMFTFSIGVIINVIYIVSKW